MFSFIPFKFRVALSTLIEFFSAGLVYAQDCSGAGCTITVQPPNQMRDLVEVAQLISYYAYRVAIPIAVLVMLYAGIKIMLAKGNPTEVSAGKNILWYAVVGVAIIVIGSGFLNLIYSILGI